MKDYQSAKIQLGIKVETQRCVYIYKIHLDNFLFKVSRSLKKKKSKISHLTFVYEKNTVIQEEI